MKQIRPFHLAFPVADLEKTHVFFKEVLGCKIGRTDERWIDFGVILEWNQWHELADRVKQHNIDFIIEPYIRFEGEPGEQATMFFTDPNGNALEFKAFKNDESIFATS